MNKYKKYFNETELLAREERKRQLNLMLLEFKKELLKYYNKETVEKICNGSDEVLFCFLLDEISTMPDKISNYIINNIINKLDKETLIKLYMISLCDKLVDCNMNQIKKAMGSFVKSGLINDIGFDQANRYFLIKTNNGEIIKFKNAFQDKKSIELARNNCHLFVQKVVENNCSKAQVFAICACMKNLINGKSYHSFMVCNKMVYDYAHNILMSFKDYKKLFSPEVIINVEGNQLFKDIEELKQSDKEFSDSDNVEILNYAIHKEMKNKKEN